MGRKACALRYCATNGKWYAEPSGLASGASAFTRYTVPNRANAGHSIHFQMPGRAGRGGHVLILGTTLAAAMAENSPIARKTSLRARPAQQRRKMIWLKHTEPTRNARAKYSLRTVWSRSFQNRI